MGKPWKEDLFSRNTGFGKEMKVVAMVAIEMDKGFWKNRTYSGQD